MKHQMPNVTEQRIMQTGFGWSICASMYKEPVSCNLLHRKTVPDVLLHAAVAGRSLVRTFVLVLGFAMIEPQVLGWL